MGTETKLRNYTENTPNASDPNSKAVGGFSAGQFNCVHIDSDSRNVSKSSIIPYVPIHVDENNVIEGAKEILSVIRPQWDLKDVEFKKFTDGITNKLVGCFYKQVENNISTFSTNGNDAHNCSNSFDTTSAPIRSHDDNNDSGNLSDEPDDAGSEPPTRQLTKPEFGTNNVVLVRVYGTHTDLLIDRKAEKKNLILLHSYGFAPSLYATFKNGLVYQFVPGNTLNTDNVLKPEIWRLVACRMAEMHRVVHDRQLCTNEKPVPMLWKKTQSFLDLVPDHFTDADKHGRLEAAFLPISRMRTEFESLYKHLENLGSPLVFSHNDLLLGNVVYTESHKSVTFIDYEYADYNFQAFDIGNHFAEFAGVDEVDYKRYPGREYQFEWLRVYLQTYLQRSHITDAEICRLYVQVNQFALAAHFFWTIWSLIQAEHSTIDFDYVDYAHLRYNEYLARKDEFLALDINDTSRG